MKVREVGREWKTERDGGERVKERERQHVPMEGDFHWGEGGCADQHACWPFRSEALMAKINRRFFWHGIVKDVDSWANEITSLSFTFYYIWKYYDFNECDIREHTMFQFVTLWLMVSTWSPRSLRGWRLWRRSWNPSVVSPWHMIGKCQNLCPDCCFVMVALFDRSRVQYSRMCVCQYPYKYEKLHTVLHRYS
jgi:hypothetical protein